MFTGIIETVGLIKRINRIAGNIEFQIETDRAAELRVGQSMAHNGVCLTITGANKNYYKVVVITETLKRTNIGLLKSGDHVNLERSMPLNGRFEGHIVQGHVDQTAICKDIKGENACPDKVGRSWLFTFEYEGSSENITVEKGSISVNGVSFTVVVSEANSFSVAVIPHTFENTNFNKMKTGDVVNLEFDIIGKYVKKLGPDS